ncbi:MAG: ABC transporter substrate-binding protein [Rhizobiaceae bacterium]
MLIAKTKFLAPFAALAMGMATYAHAADDVTLGLAMPLSGPWARLGELSRMGAEMAVEDINAAGGVKALGGAKLRLVVTDVGDSPEKAKNAAEQLLAANPNLSGGIGAYVSSFTLALTEVTERAQIPWVTLSFASSITSRGFNFVYQTSPTAEKQAVDALPTIMKLAEEAVGEKPDRVGIVMDNTASPVNFTKPMREGLVDELGLELVVDQIFTPPLSDAGPMVQQVRTARPDFLLLLPTAVPDIKLSLEKLTEFGLTRDRLPVIGNGGPMGSPDLLNIIGKEQLENMMFITANWPSSAQQELQESFKQRTGQPWMPLDSISTYGHVWVLKEAVEMAASPDPVKVNQALKEMDLTTGPAEFFPGGRIKFAENGRREDAPLVIVQWQKGVPVMVFPPEGATAEPIWPKP